MQKIKDEQTSVAITILGMLVVLISLIAIAGWIFNSTELLEQIPRVAVMKFNTALAFLLSGTILFFYKKDDKLSHLTSIIISIVVTLIGGITLGEYLFDFNFSIDTLLFNDPYAENLPGRMPPVTAFCFILLGVSIWGMRSTSYIIQRIFQWLFFMLILIVISAIITFILQLHGAFDPDLLFTMPIHSSALFLTTAGVLSLRNAVDGYNYLAYGPHAGTQLVKGMLPYNVTMILVMSFLFLYLVNHDIMAVTPAFIIYTILAVVVSTGGVLGTAVRFNATDKKKEEFQKSLESSNLELSHLKYALDESSLIAFTDTEGLMTYVNDKFCEVSKYSRNELIGNTHYILNSGFHSDEFFENIWAQIAKGEVWIGGVKNKAKDGSFYWVHTAIIPFKDEEGKIYQYLTIMQDITQLRTLSSQYESLKIKNKETEQFAYIASHDLQEPLRTVTNMVGFVQQEYKSQLDDEAQVCLNFVMQATDRMSNLIKGLLDYSRIGGNRQLEVLDLNEMMSVIKQDLSAAISGTNTTLTIDALPRLSIYPIEMRLLFQNLITNAIKFQKKDNTPTIHISAHESFDHWTISIADNGIGISKENKQNIFAIFQRLNNRNEYEGTGIGLAHCEKITLLHGGKIWVESELDKGSTFHFSISKNLI